MKILFVQTTLAILFFSSCSHSPNKEERIPSSEPLKCAYHFEPSTLKAMLEKASDANNGLTQTYFTSTKGKEHKKGVDKPKRNKNQIVSFYTDKKSDGSPNRGGVMVQGTPTEIIFDQFENPAYISFSNQPVRLLEFTTYMNVNSTQVIKGQDYDQHPQGFSSPLGVLKGWKAGLNEFSIADLKQKFEALTVDGVTTLEFESGVIVKGIIEKYTENNSSNFDSATVITFKEGTCKVTLGSRLLFDPSWGTYDMSIGTVINETNASANSPMYHVEK